MADSGVSNVRNPLVVTLPSGRKAIDWNKVHTFFFFLTSKLKLWAFLSNLVE